jgi:N-acetylmuramoyl-L-alanine amidase
VKLAVVSFIVAVLALVQGAAAIPPPRPSTSVARIGGRDYLSVAGWAKANGFTARWLKRDETLQIANDSSRITLEVDSCDAQINGVGLRLLFPVVKRPDGVFFALLDAQTTFRPILNPPKNRLGAKIKTICLDPGHGGKDPGSQVGGHDEKQYNLLLAREVQSQLVGAGFKVSLTRTRDASIELPDRPEIANHRKADLFISLHFNIAPASPASIQGTEVYCMTPVGAPSSNAHGEGAGAGWFPGNQNNEKNLFLAYQLQKSLTQGLAAEDRSARRARYWVLRDATMPAVLIEAGYMSHPIEGKKIFDPAYRRQIAHAILDGLLAYKHTVERL